MTRILIVEDEHHIQLLISSILFRQGHQVKESPNSLAALEMMRTFVPDLLSTDLRMPLMRGDDLDEFINKQFPEISIGIISAYLDDLPKHFMKDVGVYLKKPFARSQLI